MDRGRSVAMLVGSSSPYNALFLQAGLLGSELACAFGAEINWVITDSLGRSLAGLRSLNRDDYAIYHYGSFDWAAFGLASRPKTVFVYHNVTPAHFFWKWQPQVGVRSWLSRLQLLSMPKSIPWVAVSDFNARCLRELGFRNVSVCPLLVQWDRPNHGAARKQDELLFVGRISPNKNCDTLLFQTAKAAEALGRRLSLTVVGDVKPGCPYGARFERLVREFEDHPLLEVRWIVGGIQRSALAELYDSAALYVSTSLHEGFGLPVVEAIAHGCPAVYVECGGTETLLAKLGMVPAAEVDSYWERLVELLSQPDRLEALGRAQAAKAQDFSPSRVQAEIGRVYGRLLGYGWQG